MNRFYLFQHCHIIHDRYFSAHFVCLITKYITNRWNVWLLNIQRQIVLTHSGREQVHNIYIYIQKWGRYGTINFDCYLKSNQIFGYNVLTIFHNAQRKLLTWRKHDSLHSRYPLPVFPYYTEHNPHREHTIRPFPGNALRCFVGSALVIQQEVQPFIVWCK